MSADSARRSSAPARISGPRSQPDQQPRLRGPPSKIMPEKVEKIKEALERNPHFHGNAWAVAWSAFDKERKAKRVRKFLKEHKRK